jgi:hypothetical protein
LSGANQACVPKVVIEKLLPFVPYSDTQWASLSGYVPTFFLFINSNTLAPGAKPIPKSRIAKYPGWKFYLAVGFVNNGGHMIDLLQQFAESSDPDGELARQLSPLKLAIHAVLLFSDFEPRLLAACALARLEASEAILPTLIDGLRSEDVAHKVYSAYACRSLGPAAAQAVPALTVLLKDENSAVVQHAIQALGSIGPAATPATPLLIELLNVGPDSLVIDIAHAWAAATALGAIGDQKAIPALTECLDLDADGDELLELVKEEAAVALRKISG